MYKKSPIKTTNDSTLKRVVIEINPSNSDNRTNSASKNVNSDFTTSHSNNEYVASTAGMLTPTSSGSSSKNNSNKMQSGESASNTSNVSTSVERGEVFSRILKSAVFSMYDSNSPSPKSQHTQRPVSKSDKSNDETSATIFHTSMTASLLHHNDTVDADDDRAISSTVHVNSTSSSSDSTSVDDLLKYNRFLGLLDEQLLNMGVQLPSNSNIIEGNDSDTHSLYEKCLQRHEEFVKLGYI